VTIGILGDTRAGKTYSIARLISELKHPNIAELYESFEYRGDVCVVGEYVSGLPLNELIESHGPLRTNHAIELGVQLADALIALHRAGVVHTDLRPENIVLSPSGLKLVDVDPSGAGWGLRYRQPTLYAAPERLSAASVGPQADLYSLGAILYVLLEGTPPGGARPALLNYSTPSGNRLQGIVNSMLDLDPNCRPSAIEVRAALSEIAPQQGAAQTDSRETRAIVSNREASANGFRSFRRILSRMLCGAASTVAIFGQRNRGLEEDWAQVGEDLVRAHSAMDSPRRGSEN